MERSVCLSSAVLNPLALSHTCVFSVRRCLQEGKRVLVFSYGSGLMSTLFSFKVNAGAGPFTLQSLVDNLRVSELLDSRTKVGPSG